MEQNKLCITVAEMSESLRIGLTAAYRLAKDKEFYPAKRVCGRIVISKAELSCWLGEQSKDKTDRKN